MFGSKKPKSTEFTISNQTMLRIIGFILGTVFFLRLLETMRHPLTLIFVSIFLALALNPMVHKVSSLLKSKSRVRATAIAYAAVVGVLIAFTVLIVPPLVDQTTEFIRTVPDTLDETKQSDSSVGQFIRRYNLEEQVQNFASGWSSNLGDVQGPVLTTANRVFANVISIVTVLVLTFMMLIEGPRWNRAIWKQVPAHRRKHDKAIAEKMYKVITSYVNGQVLVAAIGASAAVIALIIFSTIFDVTVNAVALGGIVFLFALIPTIGTILGASIVALFSLFSSPALAVAMILFFIVYQQIENATIQPLIQSRGIDLTPLLVFLAAVLGIGLGGVLGGFLAIPLAGCIKVLVEDRLRERREHVEAEASSEEKSA